MLCTFRHVSDGLIILINFFAFFFLLRAASLRQPIYLGCFTTARILSRSRARRLFPSHHYLGVQRFSSDGFVTPMLCFSSSSIDVVAFFGSPETILVPIHLQSPLRIVDSEDASLLFIFLAPLLRAPPPGAVELGYLGLLTSFPAIAPA